MKMISELNDHEHVEGQFLVGNASKGVNTVGGSYFSVELRDASGTIAAKKWDATLADEQIFAAAHYGHNGADNLMLRDFAESMGEQAMAFDLKSPVPLTQPPPRGVYNVGPKQYIPPLGG